MNVLRRVGGGGGGSSSSSNANASQANAGFDVNASSSGANGLAGSGTGGLGHADHSDGLGGGGADGSSSPPDKHFGLENVSAPRLHWTILVLPGGELPLIRFVLSCPVLHATRAPPPTMHSFNAQPLRDGHVRRTAAGLHSSATLGEAAAHALCPRTILSSRTERARFSPPPAMPTRSCRHCISAGPSGSSWSFRRSMQEKAARFR